MLSAISNAVKGITSVINPIESIIGAGIGAASSLIGGNQQNAASAEQAAKQMDFQERMRATQYQTAVADLKAAGLNPMLAYQQGGAGTPSGAMATQGNPLGESGNSAREAAMAVAQYRQLQTQNALTQQQTEKTQADTNLSNDQAAYTRANTARELAQMPGYGKFGQLRDAQIKQLTTSSALQASQVPYYGALTGLTGQQQKYTKQLTGLAESGSAPSAAHPIYQDAKNMLHHAWDRFHQYPKMTTPSKSSFGLK